MQKLPLIRIPDNANPHGIKESYHYNSNTYSIYEPVKKDGKLLDYCLFDSYDLYELFENYKFTEEHKVFILELLLLMYEKGINAEQTNLMNKIGRILGINTNAKKDGNYYSTPYCPPFDF